jgi:ribose 5-phosphate isomerase B
MRMAIGCDHVGFPHKATVMTGLGADGHAVLDLGTHGTDPVEYPALARAVATAIGNGFVDAGILLCASGMGGAMAANKLKAIRAGDGVDVVAARRAREELDVNLLCLDAAELDADTMAAIAREWAGAAFVRTDAAMRALSRIAEIESGKTSERSTDVASKPSRPAVPPKRAATAPAMATRTAAPVPHARDRRLEPEPRRVSAAVAATDAVAVEAFLAGVKDDNVKAMTARIFEFMRGRFPRASGTPHPDGFSFHVGNEHAASVTVGKGFVQLEAGPDRIPTSRIRDVEGLEVALALPSIVRAMAAIKP